MQYGSDASDSASDDSQGTIDYPDTPSTGRADLDSPVWTVDEPSPTHMTCNCCFNTECVPLRDERGTYVTRLSEVNRESHPEFYTHMRLGDHLLVTAGCGRREHAVCVACIRTASRANRRPMLGCLAVATDVCRHTYGDGIRWCLTPEENRLVQGKRRRQSSECTGCATSSCHDLSMIETTRQGCSVKKCECGARTCLECGAMVNQDVCGDCQRHPAPPLRPSRSFPSVCNGTVTRAMIVQRAVQVLRDAGRVVRCDRCGIRIERRNGCKIVTHCGVDVCSECNTRGCSSTGAIEGGNCCTATAALPAYARPTGRVALSLATLGMWHDDDPRATLEALMTTLVAQFTQV